MRCVGLCLHVSLTCMSLVQSDRRVVNLILQDSLMRVYTLSSLVFCLAILFPVL